MTWGIIHNLVLSFSYFQEARANVVVKNVVSGASLSWLNNGATIV